MGEQTKKVGKIWYQTAGKKYEMSEQEIPKAEPGCVVVKIRMCNICGSDMKEWGSDKTKPGCSGHEFVGEILELGEGVETDYAGNKVQPGDRIVAPYYITCMKCSRCAVGDFANCENAYRYLRRMPNEYPHYWGVFSTHYYLHQNQVFYKVPDDLDDELVVGVNCALSQVYAGLDILNVGYDEWLLIQGAGGLGLYASAIAKERGAKVIVVDAVKERLELAKRFGADEIIDINEFKTVEERIEESLRITGGKGADCALEVTGVPDAFEEGLRHLKQSGKYATIGNNFLGRETTFSPAYITRKNIHVIGVVRYMPNTLLKAMKFLQNTKDKYPYKEISGKVYPLDDIQNVMQLAYDRKIARAALRP